MGYIYLIYNKVNGKKYIGKTIKSVKTRFKEHMNKARRGVKTFLYNAIRKYGEENFEVRTLLKNIPDKELNYYEILWIKKLNTNVKANGYNMTDGGEGMLNFQITDEYRQKISMASKRMWEEKHSKGIFNISKVNMESIRKRSLNKKWKENISKARMGKFTGKDNPFFGKKHSLETKEIISKKNTKYKVLMCKDNKIIMIFDNEQRASEWLLKNNFTKNIHCQSLINNVCLHRNNCKIAYGFNWYHCSVETNCKPGDELLVEVQGIL